MHPSQKHIDLIVAYMRAFNLQMPTPAAIEKAGEHITKFNPVDDGSIYMEVPQAHGELLVAMFTFKSEIADAMKGLLRENLRKVKEDMEGEQGKGKKLLSRLFAQPDPPAELRDKMRYVSMLDDMIWNTFRQLMVETGVIETGQMDIGLRRGPENSYIIVALDPNRDKSEDDEEGNIGDRLGQAIGGLLEEILKEDETKPSAPKEDTPVTPPTPSPKDTDVAGNMGDILGQLGIAMPDAPKTPDSPEQ